MVTRHEPPRSASGGRRREPAGQHRAPERSDEIGIHIFTVSATLVGVCLTVIGLLRVIDRLRPVGTFADELLSLDAVAFLVACASSYAALRSRDLRRRRALEALADRVFLPALVLMTAIAVVITFELF